MRRAVVAAKARVSEPWPERRAAARAVRRDGAEETQRFVSANFAALLDEMEPDCVRPAQRVDAAAQEVVDAAADRDQCHQRVEAVAQIVLGQTPDGDVPPSAADGLLREAERLIARGGEHVPDSGLGCVRGLASRSLPSRSRRSPRFVLSAPRVVADGTLKRETML
jgi:hypothetical protein